MLGSQAQNATSDSANSQEPDQAESARQSSHDLDFFGNPTPGSLADAGPPGQHGGFDMSGFDLNWLPPSYQSPDFNLHAPSMNQGFNSMIPSHGGVQQHQWNPGTHFPPSNPPLNHFSAPPPFDPTGYPKPALLTEAQLFRVLANDQSTAPPLGTQVLRGQNVPAQQPAPYGALSGVQSPHTNRQAGFQGLMSSPTETHTKRNQPTIPFQTRREPLVNEIRTSSTNNQVIQNNGNTGRQIPAPDGDQSPNMGQDEADFNVPGWISLIKPRPQGGDSVIKLRRETHVALEIIVEQLPNQLPMGFSGLKIPATGSVKNYANATGKTLLLFSIHVSGATSKQRYEAVCANCEKREGKKKGTPSMIDFHALRDIIEPKDGKVRIEFSFCCYPKCHQDSGYVLDILISEDTAHNRIVAQCQLPFSFDVRAKHPQEQARPPVVGGKRNRRQMEQLEGAPSTVDHRNVRARVAGPLLRDPAGIDHPMPPFNPQDRDASSPSTSPPALPQLPPPRNVGPNSDPYSAWKPPPQAIAPPPTADGEPTPTLTEVNPESGAITGGTRIWLKGMDFPALFPLFARFGTAIVPTTFSASNLLACHLPPAPGGMPAVVDVTLSKHPQPSAPEYGTSIAKFKYLGDHDQLIPILLRIQGQGYPEFSPVLQALLTALNGPQPNRGPQGGSRGAGPRDDPIETGLIEALGCLQARPNFHEIVSTTNDYNQTLAHLSVFYDYPFLLECLVGWCINVTIADVNGLTALHCAYMKGDLESVRILRRGGASETVTDQLGRTPSELLPEGLEGLEGFASNIDIDAEVALALDAEVPDTDDMDEQLALGEQFSALDLDDENDSGHGQSESEDDASDGEDLESMAVDTFAEGGSGGVASGSGGGQFASGSKEPVISIMNQLLLEKNKRKKKKNRGPRMLPDTPYDAAISSVSKKLREAEAEPEALDFLTSGLFPDGTISLVSLKTEMTAEEINDFQFPPGTLKYHGLLRRHREIVYCRLCPEDNQLDFKDPEEALHHMTKDHFDMGYSCDCGCKETYWTSADWRRHRRRKGLSLTQGPAQSQSQALIVEAN